MEPEQGLTTQADPSLREQLAENLANLPESPEPEAPEETAEAERLRDEKGRFAAAEKESDVKSETPAPAAPTVTVAEPVAKRPSSWKKEMWPVWDKLATGQPLTPDEARTLAKYSEQRESEFAKGVSTYKQEYDRLKDYESAISPILPVLEQNGREFKEWVNTMASVHQTFAFGTPQQKIQATLQLLQDYNVPLLEYLQQGGQLPQPRPFTPPAQQPVDVDKLVEQKLTAREMQREIRNFQAAKDDKGNPKYPHFETVKQSMIGLLQAGLADDLPGAYEKAIRMHDDIWQAEQQAKAEREKADAEAKAKAESEAKKAKAQRARANAVSTPSATPTGNMTSAGDKSLRDSIRDNLREVAGGRV